MREVRLIYLEVINETEQVYVFETTFNRQGYARLIILNTALPREMQDKLLGDIILSLQNLTREVIAIATVVECKEECKEGCCKT